MSQVIYIYIYIERERERERERGRERVCVCVCKTDRVCVYECLCVWVSVLNWQKDQKDMWFEIKGKSEALNIRYLFSE